MAPEKKAKPRLDLFLYNMPNPACQNPDPEGHLRIQKAQKQKTSSELRPLEE